MDASDVDADADGDTDEDEDEDAFERDAVLQDVIWNGESDTSSRIDDSGDGSLGSVDVEPDDDAELVLPSVEQQQDIATVEHFFAHSAAPSPSSTASSSPSPCVPQDPSEVPSIPSPPTNCQYSTWSWYSYPAPWAPRVASPLAVCCYVAPSLDDESGGIGRKRFHGLGYPSRIVNPEDRETGIWKMACRSRISEV